MVLSCSICTQSKESLLQAVQGYLGVAQSATVTVDDPVVLMVQLEESAGLSSVVCTQHASPLPVSLHSQQRDKKTGSHVSQTLTLGLWVG